MTQTELSRIIFNALEMINQSRADDKQIPVEQGIALYGASGYLDSMDLVSLLIDIEEALLDQGIDISLSDDRAMSEQQSPFKNVDTLISFIETAIKDA